MTEARRLPARIALALVATVLLALVPGSARAAPSNGSDGSWTLVGGSNTVSAMTRLGDVVYMGGSFRGIGRRAPRLTTIDLGSGDVALPLTALEPAIPPRAVAAAPGGGAYIGGAFHGAGEVLQPGLLRYTADGKISRSFRPRIELGVSGSVEDIEVGPDGTVYVAGSFDRVGGQTRNGLAAFDDTTGALTAWNPQAVTAGGEPADIQDPPRSYTSSGSFST